MGNRRPRSPFSGREFGQGGAARHGSLLRESLALGLLDRNDVAPEWAEGDRDQLEVRKSERDTDDR
jgi:hypothetical protein